MSVILGIFSRKGPLADGSFRRVLNDFTLCRKRDVHTCLNGRVMFAAAKDVIPRHSKFAASSDGSLQVLLGGMLYGTAQSVKKLRQRGYTFRTEGSFAEFILHAYEAWGTAFLKGLNGTFAFALYDRTRDKFIIANDTFGLYPLFIYHDSDYVIFSSEYGPLTKCPGFDRRLNPNAVAEYFTLGLPLGNKTFFQNIEHAGPASLIEIQGSRMKRRRYDDLDIALSHTKKMSYFTEKMAHAIRQAVQARVTNPSRTTCNLTGGADTRLILSNLTAAQRTAITFRTNSGYHLHPKDNRDVIIATMLAERLRLRHRVITHRRRQPDFGVAYFNRIREQCFTPFITGHYGGEFLGGCGFGMAPIRSASVDRRAIDQKLRHLFTKSFLAGIDHPADTLQTVFGGIAAESREQYLIINQLTRGVFTSIYGGSWAGWLEPYRFPLRLNALFLDTDFLRLLLRIPPALLRQYNLYNQLYKNHFPELIGIPTNSDIARRADSCMTYITAGREPKASMGPRNTRALHAYLRSHHTWDKRLFNQRYIKAAARQGTHPDILLFTDFEAWYRNYVVTR